MGGETIGEPMKGRISSLEVLLVSRFRIYLVVRSMTESNPGQLFLVQKCSWRPNSVSLNVGDVKARIVFAQKRTNLQ